MKFKKCKAPIIKLHLRNKSQYNLCVTDTEHFLMKLKETYQNGGLYRFTDWKNQYCKAVRFTKTKLEI